MPIYEYRCADCSTDFEKLVWNSKDEIICCPNCQGEKVIRVLSAFSKSGGMSGKGVSLPSSCGSSSSGFS